MTVLDLLVTELSTSVEIWAMFITVLAGLIVAAKDLRLAFVMLFIFINVEIIILYEMEMNLTYHVVGGFTTFAFMAVAIFISSRKRELIT